jgi:hypothetical protein
MFDEKLDDTKGVIRRRTNSTMARVNRTTKKSQKQKLHRKRKIKQHESHKRKRGEL